MKADNVSLLASAVAFWGLLALMPGLAALVPFARWHHERFDGLGYPYRMAGEDISAAGRMAAIVDT